MQWKNKQHGQNKQNDQAVGYVGCVVWTNAKQYKGDCGPCGQRKGVPLTCRRALVLVSEVYDRRRLPVKSRAESVHTGSFATSNTTHNEPTCISGHFPKSSLIVSYRLVHSNSVMISCNDGFWFWCATPRFQGSPSGHHCLYDAPHPGAAVQP